MIITELTFRDFFWIWNKEEHRQEHIKTRDINELVQKLSHNYIHNLLTQLL